MNVRSVFPTVVLGALAVAAAWWPAAAAARSKSEVLASMKARYAALDQLVAARKLGETHQASVEAVKNSYLGEKVTVGGKTITVQQLVSGENTDRNDYFQIAAKEQGTSPAVVARAFAQRMRSKLRKGEYWKGPSGTWEQVK